MNLRKFMVYYVIELAVTSHMHELLFNVKSLIRNIVKKFTKVTIMILFLRDQSTNLSHKS